VRKQAKESTERHANGKSIHLLQNKANMNIWIILSSVWKWLAWHSVISRTEVIFLQEIGRIT
jgi:hypothetical protein